MNSLNNHYSEGTMSQVQQAIKPNGRELKADSVITLLIDAWADKKEPHMLTFYRVNKAENNCFGVLVLNLSTGVETTETASTPIELARHTHFIMPYQYVTDLNATYCEVNTHLMYNISLDALSEQSNDYRTTGLKRLSNPKMREHCQDPYMYDSSEKEFINAAITYGVSLGILTSIDDTLGELIDTDTLQQRMLNANFVDKDNANLDVVIDNIRKACNLRVKL
jgi:hypothetical protein